MKNIKYILLQSLRCILFIFTFIVLSLILNKDLDSLSKWWSIIASIINIVTLLIILLICKRKNISYGDLLKIKKEKIRWKYIVGIVILFLLIGVGGMYLAGFICYHKFPYMAVMMIRPIPVILAILNVLILPITTTLAEDGLYLGLGVNNINNKWISILIPAFFYALQHSFIPFILDINFIVYRFLSFLPLTIIICNMYYKKRDAIPIMAGHFFINLLTVGQIILTSVSPEIFEMMSNF